MKTCRCSMLEGYVEIKPGREGLTLNSEFIRVSLFILLNHFVFNIFRSDLYHLREKSSLSVHCVTITPSEGCRRGRQQVSRAVTSMPNGLL